MYETKLKYFLCAAKRLSFTKAAEDCHVTQSTISKQISSLEDEMGTALFCRHRSALSLTAAGEILAAKAEDCIRQYEKINRSVLSLENSGELIVGAGEWEWVALSRPLFEFRAANPLVPVRGVLQEKHELEEQVLSGSIDAALVRRPTSEGGLRVTPLGQSGWCVCAAADSDFWALPHEDRRLFKGRVIVALASDLNDVVKPYCASLSAEHVGFNVCGHITPLITLVKAGAGEALVPGFFSAMLPGGLRCEKLPGPRLTSQYAVITASESHGAPADIFAAICAGIYGAASGTIDETIFYPEKIKESCK